jgi:hypothetical protein
MMTASAACLIAVDFPDMLGPVRSMKRRANVPAAMGHFGERGARVDGGYDPREPVKTWCVLADGATEVEERRRL